MSLWLHWLQGIPQLESFNCNTRTVCPLEKDPVMVQGSIQQAERLKSEARGTEGGDNDHAYANRLEGEPRSEQSCTIPK